MTKAQYNTLKTYEDSFKQAKKGYYRSLLSTDVVILNNVYEQLGYHLDSKNCSRCILGMLKDLGNEYDKYVSKKSNKEQKESTQKELTKINNEENEA